MTVLAVGAVNAAAEIEEPAASKSPARLSAIAAFCMTVSPLAVGVMRVYTVFLPLGLIQPFGAADGSVSALHRDDRLAVA
jgi:hypothetical protein